MADQHADAVAALMGGSKSKQGRGQKKPRDQREISSHNSQTSQKTRPPGSDERQPVKISVDVAEKARACAYWERIGLSELVDTAVRAHVEKLEKKHGEPYKPIKELKRGRRPGG